MSEKVKYLLLGGGIGSVSTAAALRKFDGSSRILILEKSAQLPYNRPRLSKTWLKGYDPKEHLIHPPAFYKEKGVEIQTEATVERLVPGEHRAVLLDGTDIVYEKCLYGLGAVSYLPPIKGADIPGVLTIRTAEDIFRLKKRLACAKTALIIGGGVIGLELALTLAAVKIDVTVVEGASYLLSRFLDRQMAGALRTRLELERIRVLTGAPVSEIRREHTAWQAVLKDGLNLKGDMVILCAGVRPNTGLAKDAGLITDRGVIADNTFRTSDPDVYTCGDSMQRNQRAESSWAEILSQAPFVAENMAGGIRCYPDIPVPKILNSGRIWLYSIGDIGKKDGSRYERLIPERMDVCRNRFRVNPEITGSLEPLVSVYVSGGIVVGAAMINDWRLMNRLRLAVREGWPVEKLAEKGVALCSTDC
ncbi:MAG: NAD(P)/FAD-dependent oxidoreductase [Lachnospiraceae bacterium]|nr:NAD(P)/FAD-dependent oxidoreductase [Lachnospiraceae bacterium]